MNVQPWIASKVTNKLQGSHLAKHENMKGLKLDVPNIIECFPLYKSNFLLFSDIKYPQSNRSVPKKNPIQTPLSFNSIVPLSHPITSLLSYAHINGTLITHLYCLPYPLLHAHLRRVCELEPLLEFIMAL